MSVDNINNAEDLKTTFEHIQETINKLSISEVQKLAFSNALQMLSTVSQNIETQTSDGQLSLLRSEQKFNGQTNLIRDLKRISEKFTQNPENSETQKDFLNQLNILVKTVFEVESYLSKSEAKNIINSLGIPTNIIKILEMKGTEKGPDKKDKVKDNCYNTILKNIRTFSGKFEKWGNLREDQQISIIAGSMKGLKKYPDLVSFKTDLLQTITTLYPNINGKTLLQSISLSIVGDGDGITSTSESALRDINGNTKHTSETGRDIFKGGYDKIDPSQHEQTLNIADESIQEIQQGDPFYLNFGVYGQDLPKDQKNFKRGKTEIKIGNDTINIQYGYTLSIDGTLPQGITFDGNSIGITKDYLTGKNSDILKNISITTKASEYLNDDGSHKSYDESAYFLRINKQGERLHDQGEEEQSFELGASAIDEDTKANIRNTLSDYQALENVYGGQEVALTFKTGVCDTPLKGVSQGTQLSSTKWEDRNNSITQLQELGLGDLLKKIKKEDFDKFSGTARLDNGTTINHSEGQYILAQARLAQLILCDNNLIKLTQKNQKNITIEGAGNNSFVGNKNARTAGFSWEPKSNN